MQFLGRLVRTENDPEPPRYQQRGRNYDWKCVDGPAEFCGNLFRYTDIVNGGFPIGTTFQRVDNPKKTYTVSVELDP